jgi:hypothetical protein
MDDILGIIVKCRGMLLTMGLIRIPVVTGRTMVHSEDRGL